MERCLFEHRTARGVDDDRIDRAPIGADDEVDANPAFLAAAHLAVREFGRRLLYGRGGNPARVHFHVKRLRVGRCDQQG